MSEFNRPRVPVAEEDKKRSYYKYYSEPMVPGDPAKFQKVLAGPIDPSKALPFAQRNRLFEPGYLEEELGYCIMPDGTGYLANLTHMPGVTTEMFDWWFAWPASTTCATPSGTPRTTTTPAPCRRRRPRTPRCP